MNLNFITKKEQIYNKIFSLNINTIIILLIIYYNWFLFYG